VTAPLPRQSLPLELLDPEGCDLVENQRAQGPIERLQDLSIAADAPLVLLGVLAQVGLAERFERDVGLLPDTVAALEDARPLGCFDLLRSCLSDVSVVFRYRFRFTRKS
jgi:hypothetical protein